MLAGLISLLVKIKLILICHFNLFCWQIGDNMYNCRGNHQCEEVIQVERP